MGMTGIGKRAFRPSWQYLHMDCNTNKHVVGVRLEQKSIMTTFDQLDSFTYNQKSQSKISLQLLITTQFNVRYFHEIFLTSLRANISFLK